MINDKAYIDGALVVNSANLQNCVALDINNPNYNESCEKEYFKKLKIKHNKGE